MKSEGITSSRPPNEAVSTKPAQSRAQSPQDKADAARARQDKDPLAQREAAAGKINASALEPKEKPGEQKRGNNLSETA